MRGDDSASFGDDSRASLEIGLSAVSERVDSAESGVDSDPARCLARCRGRLQTCQFFLYVPETSLGQTGDVSAVPDLFSSSQKFFNKSLKNMGTCLDIS